MEQRLEKENRDKKNTFKVITFGCPVNQYESIAIESAMTKQGFIRTEGHALVNIINSCVVTGSAAAEARRMVRKIKREDPRALVVLAGCYPQVYHANIVQEVPDIDIIIGTRGRSQIATIVRQFINNNKNGLEVQVTEHKKEDKFEEFLLGTKYDRIRPAVKIQEGCNEFCTYCIIRKARGPSKSWLPEKVVAQVELLLDKGHKEIILTGNQLGLYGLDLDGEINLPGIIEEISKLPYDFRIRLNYIEPMNVTTQLLETVAGNPKVCNHLYIPVQSCSDRVLKRMGRRYRAADFMNIVQQAKSLVSDISIWTDLIVGFPGEEEEDHTYTMDMVRQLELAHLHVFPYSPRPGTPAARFVDNVRPDIKKRRVEEMKKLDSKLIFNYNNKMPDKDLRVILEKKVDSNEQEIMVEGYADNYVTVRVSLESNIPFNHKLTNRFVTTHIEDNMGGYVVGRLIYH